MADFNTADILLPKNIKNNWAVIACDQFTSDIDYWKKVQQNVGVDASTYNMIFPEILLNDNSENRIENINKTMQSYFDNGVFEEFKNSMIYVSRTQSDGAKMDGIVGTINLDDYDYRPGASSVTRATEQTVIERIPPRVAIRKNALLEFPHILLLIDDPDFTVIEPIDVSKNKKLYDLTLMLDGGNAKGWLLNETQVSAVQNALERLKEKNGGFLFAVGDGNHSLATAKECSALNKTKNASRALVEIVNIHSSAINFEPIYRVLFECEPLELLNEFVQSCGGEYFGEDAQQFTFLHNGNEQKISVKPTAKLPVGTLQSFLDKYLQSHRNVKIDYIHGTNETRALCQNESTAGFLFEGMTKQELFPAIIADGSLPRKTFSMGHANDKRYYIEGRKIK